MALGELKNGIGPDAYAIYQQVLAAVVERDHPVGSLYISAEATSPASLFGGTWEQIKDRFILAAGDTYAAGSTGGTKNVTLTSNMIPSIHSMVAINGDTSFTLGGWDGDNFNNCVKIASGGAGDITSARFQIKAAYNNFTPESVPILNPYIAMYVWKRIA